MPLTSYQKQVVKLLSSNRTPDSYLAGGAAIHLEPQSKRYSNDLDYFQDSEERVASAFREDRQTLIDNGYEIEISINQPGFIRAIVRRDDEATKIEWARDSSWRFLPPVKDADVGYHLHPIDLAINKLLALVGRDEPRDYLDIHSIMKDTLPLGALCWAASGKDPGFTPLMLLELLRRRGKYRPEDFARLNLTSPVDLPALKARWLEALDDAERFVASRPPEEMGCLYYKSSTDSFVQPTAAESGVVVHYGRPGGVMPSIASDADSPA